MSKTKDSPQRRKGAEKPPQTFAERIEEQSKRIIERLQFFGDLPQVDERTACQQDWQALLMQSIADIFEHCRLDESDPLVQEGLLKDLALLSAVCREWAKQMEAE